MNKNKPTLQQVYNNLVAADDMRRANQCMPRPLRYASVDLLNIQKWQRLPSYFKKWGLPPPTLDVAKVQTAFNEMAKRLKGRNV